MPTSPANPAPEASALHPTALRTFRLPTDVRPQRYQASLRVDLTQRSFCGDLCLEIHLAQPSHEVVLHALELSIDKVAASIDGHLHPATWRTEAVSQTLILTFDTPLQAGTTALHITYTGRFCDGLRGLYSAGPELAATQFEAADARRVFPCFDEPGFKAPWQLTLEAPVGYEVLSNGPVEHREVAAGWQRLRFGQTVALPSYLIAFAIGRFGRGQGAAHAADSHPVAHATPIATWAVPQKLHLTAFAQEVAQNVLPRLEAWFGLPYVFGKLDQIGLPDFEAGAMENAGLVTYREVALLLDPALASLAQRKRVAEVVTHELAHQWFGNLVTMTWWDDLWLNEAFATWMANVIVDQWKPEWKVWRDFDGGKASAMALDALRSTHPIRSVVHTVEDATESFDLITYEKGGATLRMIERFLGAEAFRAGVGLYMKRHAYGNAVAADLWKALGESSGQPVTRLADAWLEQPGFPVVHAQLHGHTLHLSQQRFFSKPGESEAGVHWPVPLVVRYQSGGQTHSARILFDAPTTTLDLAGVPDYVVLNDGATGVYRVAPDASLLAGLRAHLHLLDAAERTQLLSDEWALVRAGMREVGVFFDLLAAFGDETDYAVLDAVVGRLEAIDYRLVAEADRPALAGFVQRLLHHQLAQVGWEAAADEPDATRLRRAAVVRALGLLARDADVIAQAAARLDRFIAGEHDALEANLQDAAVKMVARHGDAARFEQFHALFGQQTEPAFKRRWLMALASFEDPALAARAQQLLLGGEVPLQDWAGFAATLLANPVAREPFFAALRAEWAQVAKKLADAPMLLRRVVESLGNLITGEHLAAVRAHLAAHPVEAAKQATEQTLERLSEEVELRKRTQTAISGWLAVH
jgi:puromycin-sensitive aminopeptidase